LTITLNTDYDVALSTALLGYVGETNARPVSVEGMEIDGADRYVLTIDYGDGVTYEVDITGGQWTPTADILRSAQTATSAQQTEADKTITTGYAKTAKTCADSTAADKQAVQTLAEQVTADKANVAENAAKVAEDRKAAETAAQTAQAVADSLPEDYVTAVAKIAENTAEIANVKLTDKELQRRVDALFDIGQGVTHKFETDTDTAYQKAVPTGAKLMSVKKVGGRSIVFNQNFQPRKEINNGITATADSDGTITLNGTTTASYINFRDVTPEQNKIGKYAFKLLILNNPDNISMKFGFLNRSNSTPAITSGSSTVIYNQTQHEISLGKATGISGFVVGTVFNDVKIKIQIFDLTQMFGSGNEPSTVEEFESMFPNGYYPYNEGELMSMSVNNVVEQGKNLFDCYGFSCIAILNVNGERKLNNSYGTTISTIEPTNKIVVTQSQAPESVIAHSNNGWFCVGIKGMEQSKRYTFSFDFTTTKMLIQNPVLQILVNGRFPEDAINISELNVKKRVSFTLEYTKVDDRQYIELRLSGMSGIFENFQLDEGSTATAYTPYYTPISYTIPQAIQNLDGYGWSAGTARNYVDYENKRYVQCVGKYTFTGNENWVASGDNQYYAVLKTPATKVSDMNNKSNCLMATIPTETVNSVYGGTKTGLGINFLNNVSYAYISADDYNNRVSKINGQDMYYELATPIVTDISDLIPGDFLRNVEVEAGGSITFKNSNGGSYRIPVPSEEEYIVKLSEVGGTT